VSVTTAMGAFPNYQLFLDQALGSDDGGLMGGFCALAGSNLVFGSNPVYGVGAFLSMYPKFSGPMAPIVETATSNGTAVLSSSDVTLTVGMLVSGFGIPPNSYIIAVTPGTSFTLSNPPTTVGTLSLTFFTPSLFFTPLAVISSYIALASASLVQARWQDAWTIGVGLFVAHFLTLYLQSDGITATNAGQVASMGLRQGVITGMGAGSVSKSMQPVQGLDSWAAWNMTSYGVQLATLAKVVGGGPLLCW